MSAQQGDLVAGRYRLTARLGGADPGRLWRARDEAQNRDVALREVPASDVASAREALRDAERLRGHRNLVPLLDVVEDGGGGGGGAGGGGAEDGAAAAGTWLVLDPVPARTLAEAVEEFGALPLPQVVTIGASMLDALDAVGLEREVPPGEVLLTDDARVLLLPTGTVDGGADDAGSATTQGMFSLGSALFLAAEGRSPSAAGAGAVLQPTLAPLIRGLMERRLGADEARSELSRLAVGPSGPAPTDPGATLVETETAASATAALPPEPSPTKMEAVAASTAVLPTEPPPTLEEPVAAATAAVPSPPIPPAPAAPPTVSAAPVIPSGAPPTLAATPVVPPPAPTPYPVAPPAAGPNQPQSPWHQQGPQAANPWLQPPTSTPMPPPPSSPMPGYPQPVPPYGQPGFPAPKGHTGRNVALVLGSVAMVAVLIAVIHFATDKSGSSDNIAQTGSTTTQSSPSIPSASTPGFTYPQYTAPTDTDTPSPTDSPSAPDYTPPPADTPTSYFDPTSLNEKATDQTPLTQDAFLPQQFTDDKGVPFTLRAGGSKGCVQNAMSQNVQNLLHDNACTEMMTGDYLDQDNRVLVSVEVFPFVDESHAVAGYNAMQKDSRGVDFGIWCPTNGTGSAACDSNSDYHQAVYEQWSEQNHRYVIAALAVYVNMSNDSTVKPWLQSAAKKAVDAVGPQNYSGNQ